MKPNPCFAHKEYPLLPKTNPLHGQLEIDIKKIINLEKNIFFACNALANTFTLIAVTTSTRMTGSILISFPNALIAGTQFNSTINRKYRLANLDKQEV